MRTTTTYAALVGAALRHYRTTAGLTQEDTARLANVSQALVSKAETGAVDVPISTLRNNFAPALRVQVHEIVGLADELEAAAVARGLTVLESEAPQKIDRASASQVFELLRELDGAAAPLGGGELRDAAARLQRIAREFRKADSRVRRLTPLDRRTQGMFGGLLEYVAAELFERGGRRD